MVRFAIDYGKVGVRARAGDRLDKVFYFHGPVLHRRSHSFKKRNYC